MKKLLCLMLATALIVAPVTSVSAHQGGNTDKEKLQQTTEQCKVVQDNTDQQKIDQQKTDRQKIDQQKIKQQVKTYQKVSKKNHKNLKNIKNKQCYNNKGAQVVKYDKYILPISPVVKRMGATVAYDKITAVLTVKKDSTTIVIDFTNKTVLINGIADTTSDIFNVKNDKKNNVLIKYIAKILGVKIGCDKDDAVVTHHGLASPSNVTITPIGTTNVINTLNNTTYNMFVTANIIANQATGGKAELYVGNKLVATDSEILATDTSVTFTTSDGTPSNAELQAIVPTGGIVTVKLYNSQKCTTISNIANPTLIVDYAAPMITGLNSAIYNVSGSSITISVNSVSTIGDKVDVTKISFFDTTLNQSYQLTDAAVTGSKGIVSTNNTLLITLGSADIFGLTGFGTSTTFLSIGSDSLLSDIAGNKSTGFSSPISVPVTIIK